MMYFVTVGVVVGMVLLAMLVDHLAHRFAHRHPEFGMPKQPGACCGACGSGKCDKPN